MKINFGRLKAKDPDDKKFPLKAALRKKIVRPSSKYWTSRWVGNQNTHHGKDKSSCVGYAWHGFLQASPVNSREPLPLVIYHGAQEHDEFDGVDYEGSTVRGGAKYLNEVIKQVKEYRWAFDLDPCLDWLATKGPLVFGTDWHTGMMKADAKGFIHSTGSVEGGHAYLILGYSEPRRALRIQNSWGRGWGQKGRCWLSYDDAELLIDAAGEACTAIEGKV